MSDQLTALVLMAHADATWFMVGLIWFVQVVHYPLMEAIPSNVSSVYAKAHQRKTTWIVAPVMLIEAGCALVLLSLPHRGSAVTLAPWIGLALLILIWLSTLAVQVPLHARLASGFNRAAARRLVATNWFRTIAWSIRGFIALSMLT